jgi:hypothetical protein
MLESPPRLTMGQGIKVRAYHPPESVCLEERRGSERGAEALLSGEL